MSEEIECDKLFNVKLSLKHYDEEMKETVQEKLYWSSPHIANIGWCAGVHISAAIDRLFPGVPHADDRRDCFRAIIDHFEGAAAAGDYKHLEKEK